ncbi:D-glycero-beta-D-manno-heptose 1,7-bisphosphate 7-phosphatase [Simiduia curdlanivorans]|uniref:D,D-heptose 1,7-bisphosphate phosphatase n=1 Tax=Simiduia curdlanivorans TaxID=1492769 RepID=A0ABV8UZN9_9GAMM|nr:D-glycero-beta-D-manno-heptose 1,7-bisphosphate 7-phosphatase [Simiduia curdlanivorans]MDN3638006.1 D-glycero-beta-D-manno-heptose 1,7-bisphosphate 7-phosphatase [Simiduia curdlanivorans]
MTNSGFKLVILDRDGVINQDSDAFVKSVNEWIPIPGSIEAIAELSRAGFTVVVATNQSGLSRGLFDLDDLEAMHAKLAQLVEEQGGSMAAVFYCPHGPDDQCNCRKPKPGLIDAIEAEFDTSAEGVPLVGDSLRDLEAGLTKGCLPILVRTGKGAATEQKLQQAPVESLVNVKVFDSLLDALPFIKDVYGQAC